MEKKLTVLTAAAAGVLLCGALAFATAYAQEAQPARAELLLPSSYEQYLALDAPADFAFSGRYIAIAERQTIYLYDKEEGEGYATFTHTNNVSSLNFYEYEGETYLYFSTDSGGSNPIQYISCEAEDFSSQTAADTDIYSCDSFVIYGEDVCFSNASNSVYMTKMDGLNILNPEEAVDDSSASTCFAVYGDNIYFAKDRIIYRAGVQPTRYMETRHDVASFILLDGTCFYTSVEGYFYRVSGEADDEVIGTADAVKLYDGAAYLLEGNGIRCYDPETGETGYEIGKYSASFNRIGQNAADLSARGNKLFIADAANERVLVLTDAAEGGYTYSAVETDGFSPEVIAAGEKGFAAADGRSLRLYSDGGELVGEKNLTAAVTQIAYSDGRYYVTANGQQLLYTVSEEDFSSWQENELSFVPLAVTADIYGDLYVLVGTSVQRLNADLTADPSLTCPAPADTKKILSDFNGGLYALANDAVYKLAADGYGAALLSSEDITPLVRYEGSAPIRSFAFDFESGKAYFLSDGFAAESDALGIASLDALDGGGAYDALNALPAEDGAQTLSLITVQPGAVSVSLAPDELTEDGPLPYHGYARETRERTGVMLAQTPNGPIVAFYEQVPEGEVNIRRFYEVKLILGGRNAAATADGYTFEPAYDTGYTVSEVGIYRYPVMRLGENGSYTDFGRFEEAARSASLTILASVRHASLDADYYFVRTLIGEREVYGYIPASFVLRYAPAGGLGSEEYRFARIDRHERAELFLTTDANKGIVLESREELKVYDGRKDENGYVYAEYEGEDGLYAGYIDPDILYKATPSVLVTLVIVLVATAALLLSGCYLILRRQPTLE